MKGSLRWLLPVLMTLTTLGACETTVSTALTQTDGQGSASPDGATTSGDAGNPGHDGTATPPGDDGSGPGVCWEGTTRCDGVLIQRCEGGMWTEAEACAQGTCVDDVCGDCTPSCEGKACGSDGCGGSCGTCDAGGACDDGQCPCVPDCAGRECGSDGCGGSCGGCTGGLACSDGLCDCAPQCAGKDCGPNGCGGQCGICQGDFACSDSGECVPDAYRAVLIQDHWTTSNGCSNYASSGADIDAVALYDAEGEFISYFVQVIEEIGEADCQNNYTDPDAVEGAPENTDGGCIALQGGWIMGRFADYVEITSGMTLVVHEFGNQQGGSSEPFSIYLSTGFDCAESDDPGACSWLISSEGYGASQVTIP